MPKLIIEAGRTEKNYWGDLWHYRELFYFLAWRDLLVRYKQTVVGVGWAVIKPFSTMLVLTMIGRVGHLPSGGAPYPLFAFCAMLPWQFFSSALSESGNSLVNNANLISKVYFPRLIVPASSIITSFVDFLISSGFLMLLMLWYHFLPPANIVVLPAFLLLAIGAAFGAGAWVAALMVEYRDFRNIVPFIVQFGLYASPVVLMTSKVPVEWRPIYSLNPMVGVIDGFRWCLLGGGNQLYWPGLLSSVLGTIFLLTSGIWYFRRTEKTFADVI